MQTIATLAIAICAYFSKYEFEGIKEEQARQRTVLSTLTTQTAINGELIAQVLRVQTSKQEQRPTR